MIVVLFGQPGCGKTPISILLSVYFKNLNYTTNIVDGDEVRKIFKNFSYDREGRIKNLNRISDISRYLSEYNNIVFVSAVYPFKESRDYLNSICDNIIWIYLTYNDDRGKSQYLVKEFEEPIIDSNVLYINTTSHTIEEEVNRIVNFINQKMN